MDPQTKWLLKQPAFWLQLAVTIVLALVTFGLIPAGRDMQLVGAFLMVMNGYGIKGHLAQPPRVPWTNEQRIAAGLEPLDTKKGE